MPSSDESHPPGYNNDWSASMDIPFLSLDNIQLDTTTDTTHSQSTTGSTATPNIPSRAQTNQTSPGIENNEFDESHDLCYISSVVEILGDGMKRLADTIVKQYAKITSETNRPEENEPEHTTAGVTQSNAATSTSPLESRHRDKDLRFQLVEDSLANVDLKEKLSELEEVSIRHSILLNNSYKSHWLLIRKVRTIQNDMKKIEKILLKIQFNQEKINYNANDIRNNLNMIKVNQQEIKSNFENIKSSQELIKKAQENILKTQLLLSEKVRATSKNDVTTSAIEDSSQNMDQATDLRPNLSFYTFNCAVPNGMKLFEVSPDLLCRIIKSKESFKSTLDYVYTQDLENSSSGKEPSFCGLLGVYASTPNILDSSNGKLKSEESFHVDSLMVENSNEARHLDSNDNNIEDSNSEVNLNNSNQDIENESETNVKEGELLVQSDSSNEEELMSNCCSDEDCISNIQAQGGGETESNSCS
ncbi:hypothetical protein WDU94_005296 [Cyamophila willieti]